MSRRFRFPGWTHGPGEGRESPWDPPRPPPPQPDPPPPEAPEPEPAAEPEPKPEPVPAPPPAATQATGQRVKVYVRLASGERVDAGSFGSLDQAKERGAGIARTLAGEAPEWPFVAGRFLRPDTIVSLDVEPELSA